MSDAIDRAISALPLVGRARTELGSQTVAWWRRQPTKRIDPRKVRWARTPVDRAAVDYYARRPNGSYLTWDSDGLPCVVIGRDGSMEGRNGKHRAIAAIATGRRLLVRIYDERAAR